MGPLLIPMLVVGIIKTVTDRSSREATQKIVSIAKATWEATDDETRKEALNKLATHAENLAKIVNENEQTRSLLVNFVSTIISITGSFVPPVIRNIVAVPTNIILFPFKKIFGKKDLSISENAIRMAQWGTYSFIGTVAASWLIACLIVRTIDQIEMNNTDNTTPSANAKVHGKITRKEKGQVTRRTLIGFGDFCFDLPYNSMLEIGFKVVIAFTIFNILNYVTVIYGMFSMKKLSP